MVTGDRSVRAVLNDLERRLSRVEVHLGFASEEDEPISAERAAVAVLEPADLEPVPEAATTLHRPAPFSVAPVSVAPIQPIPAPVVPEYQSPPPIEAVPPQSALEQTIGLKWSGWVGAVVVVIGVALGIKYAYDQKWFEVLPPAARLALMSLAAFGLVGAGEVVYRRIHRFAAACLFGAGVATFFIVSYAGFGYYRLYEQQTAFLLMGLSTVAGAAVAMRGNFVSIAVLAQIGGNLAPVLLRTDHPRLAPFLTYLLTLQLVSLTLAWWGASAKWWTLRGLSLATTSLWLLAVFIGSHFAGSNGVKLAFCLTYAGLFQAELILSTLRGSMLGLSPAPRSVDLDSTAKHGVTFSVLVTALLTAALLFLLGDASHLVRGLSVLALSGTCAGLGMLLTGEQNAARNNLAVGFRIQSAALLVAAVPVALAGVWIVVGWAMLALAFAAVGRLLDLPFARWAGAMVWRLAVLYLAWWTIDPNDTAHRVAAHRPWLHLLGANVPAFTVVAWILACAGHAVAWLIRPPGSEPADGTSQRRAWITGVSAGVLWITASAAGLPPAGATLAMLVYSWLLLGADGLDTRLGLALQSAVVVAIATIKWMTIDTLAERLAPGWSATDRMPVFNAVIGVGVLLSLTMALLYWLRRDVLWAAFGGDGHAEGLDVSSAAPTIALAAILSLVVTVGLSFEIDRVVEAGMTGSSVWPVSQFKQMAWTVLWTVVLTGFLALARKLEPVDRLRPVWVRLAEVLGLTVAVKFLLVDTLLFRVAHRPPLAVAVANFQSFTAVVVAAGMVAVASLMTRGRAAVEGEADRAPRTRQAWGLAGFLAVLVVLWGGTLEIDRAFEQFIAAGSGVFRDPLLAKQVAFSIFWSLFAVSAVVAGFRFRTAGLRYFGLGLFAVTLLKVVLLDMSQVQTGYRVLSFLGLGLLLMGTSVLYGKLSPVLLRDREPAT